MHLRSETNPINPSGRTLGKSARLAHAFTYALIFVIIFAVFEVRSQSTATQANVMTSISPPYNAPLGDLTTARLKVIITAMNGYIDQGKLSVLIQGNNGIRIQNDYARSAFNLMMVDANVYQLTDNDLQDIFNPANFTASGITVAQAFDEGLPPGSYEICFRVYTQGRTTFSPISQPPPSGCSPFIIQDSPDVMVNTIVQPPPFTPDLQEYLNKINVTLQSGSARSVRLFLTVKGDNGVVIRSRRGIITSQSIALDPGMPYMISTMDLDPYFKVENLTFTGTSAQAIFNKGLPEGNYRFCIRAVNLNGDFVSADDPVGCSNLISIKLLEPAQIIAPACGSSVAATGAPNIVFTWTIPPGAPPDLAYTLRIVEMIDASKDPNDAMFSATTPAFFEETIIGTPSFLYGPAQPLLEPGRKYAWQVVAGSGTGPDISNSTQLFRNHGRSAVCWFTYDNKGLSLPGTVAQVNTGTFNAPPGKSDPTTSGFGPAQPFIYNAIVNGTLNHHFFWSGSQPVANTNIKLVITYVREQDNKKEVLKPEYTDKGIPKYPDMGKILAISKTDNDGKFTFLCTLKDKDLPATVDGQLFLIAESGKKAKGSFQVYKTARIVVDNPYLVSPNEDITLKKDQTIDAGVLNAMVREYFMKVNLRSVHQLNGSTLESGVIQLKAQNYNVYLLRQVRPLGVPEMEGTLPHPRNTKKEMEVIGQGTSNADGSCSFLRLVKNIGPSDKYFIYAETKPENLTNFYCQPIPVAFNYEHTLSKYKITQISGPKTDDAIFISDYKIPTIEFNLPMKARAGEIVGTVKRFDNELEGVPDADVRMWELESKENLLFWPFIKPAYSNKTSYAPATGSFYIGKIYPALEYKEGSFIKKDSPVRPLRITKYGFHDHSEILEEILMGQRKIIERKLKPKGSLVGEVVNEQGEPVSAQVSVPGGNSVSTQSGGFVTQPMTKGIYAVLPTKSLFEVMAPSGLQKLSVAPHNLEAYLPYDTLINVSQVKQNAGKIKLYDNAYRIRVRVVEYSNINPSVYSFYVPGQNVPVPKPASSKVIQGARVHVQYITEDPLPTNGEGVASIKFKSMASEFKIMVEAPEGQLYETTYATVSSWQLKKAQKDYFVVDVALRKAAQISGKVMVGTSPINGAKVFVKQSGSESMLKPLEAFTKEDGTYELKDIPMNLPLEVFAVKGQSQFIGDLKQLTLTKQFNEGIDFTLTQYNGMVLTELLGIPIEVQKLEESDETIKLTGAFIQPPFLDNLSLYDPSSPLNFSNVEIVKSSKTNAEGINYGSPAAGKVPVELPFIDLKLKDALILRQKAKTELLEIKDDGNGKGLMEAPLYLDISNFEVTNVDFGSSALRIAVGAGTNQQLNVRTISVAPTAPPEKYLLVADDGKNLSFKFQNFQTEALNTSSFIDGENIRLNAILHTKLKNISPADLKLNLGEVIITKKGAGDIVDKPSFDIPIGTWKMSAKKWSISKNGFIIHDGILKAGLVDVPFTGLTILPVGLHDNASYNLASLTFNNIVTLQTTGEASFGFDNTKNLWSLRIDPKNGSSYAAVMNNLPLIKTTESFRLSSVALYNNGTSLIMMDKTSPTVTLHDLADFQPTDIQVTSDAVSILGQLDLHLTQVGKLSSGVVYKKQSGKVAAEVLPAAFSFQANAVTANFPTFNQTFSPGKFESLGEVFEEGKFKFNVKLTHTNSLSKMDLVAGQSYTLAQGKKSELKSLSGTMAVTAGKWNELYFEGDLSGTEGASGRLGFTVKGDWVANNQQIGIKNVPSSFGGIALTYNFEESRLEGSLHYDKQVSSAQHIKGDATARVDGTGWNFVGTGKLTMSNPKAEGQAGIMFGDYPMIPEIRQRFEQTSFVYKHAGHLPAIFPTQIKGFYFQGGISMPVPVIPSIDFDFGLVSGYLYVNIGGDVRNKMEFNDGLTFGTGQSIFADAGVGLGASVVVACAGCSAHALAMLNFDGQITTGGAWFVDGEGLFTLTGYSYKGFGVCDSDCDGMFCDKSSESASVTVGAKAHYGSDYEKIEFYLK